jgi:hypothetical protein
MLADALVRFALCAMSGCQLLVCIGQRLLKSLRGALVLVFGHRSLVIRKILLMSLDGPRMSIECLPMLANQRLQFRQLGQRRFVLALPTVQIDSPQGMNVIPLAMVGLHSREGKNLLVHDTPPFKAAAWAVHGDAPNPVLLL